MGVPPKMDVFFFGKIPSFDMDDNWGYFYFRTPPDGSMVIMVIIGPFGTVLGF